MKAINVELTTNFNRLPEERVSDVDFVADPTNLGTIIITIVNDEKAVIDRLAAGDSFNRETAFQLNELQARSSSSGDLLLIRW